MCEDGKVRSAHGLIAWKELDDHGFSIPQMSEWRKGEEIAGRPNSLEEFYAAHGLCLNCSGHGAQMVGWSKPSAAEVHVTDSLDVAELPRDVSVAPPVNSTTIRRAASEVGNPAKIMGRRDGV